MLNPLLTHSRVCILLAICMSSIAGLAQCEIVTTIDTAGFRCSVEADSVIFSINSISGQCPSGNYTFQVELSAKSGNFAPAESVKVIKEFQLFVSGSATVTMPYVYPANIETGDKYRIRVVSPNGFFTSTPSDSFEIRRKAYPSIQVVGESRICKGDSLLLRAPSVNGNDYQWYFGQFGQQSQPLQGENSDFLWARAPGEYSIEVTNNGCIDLEKITIYDSGVDFSGLDSAQCIDDSPDTLIGLPAGGVFSGSVTGNIFFPETPGVFSVSYSEDGNWYDVNEVPGNLYPSPPNEWNFSGNQVRFNESLGFTFDFFGENYNEIHISSNGLVGFTDTTSFSSVPSDRIPDSDLSTLNYIAFWWNLYKPTEAPLTIGRILYGNVSVGTQQYFIVEFDSVYHDQEQSFPSDPVHVQLILHEGSNQIEIQFINAGSDGTPHIVGIESQNEEGYTYYKGSEALSSIGVVFAPGEGCTCTRETIVNDLPNVTFNPLDTLFCVEGADKKLEGSIPEDGYFVGPGILNDTIFSPSLAGIGTHLIEFFHTDDNGCTNIISRDLEVVDVPSVDFFVQDTCLDLITTFETFILHEAGVSSRWDVNQDIGVAIGDSLQMEFDSAGLYLVNLYVTSDLGCDNSFSRLVEIREPPVIEMEYDTLVRCNQPARFVNTTPDTRSQTWDFGNNILGDLMEESYQFPNGGRFMFTLTVTDIHGCVASTTGSLTVNDVPPHPDSLSLFPNPVRAQRELFVTIQLYNETDVVSEIYDMAGRQVDFTDFGRVDSGDHNLCINVSHLPRGIYTLAVIAGGKRINRNGSLPLNGPATPGTTSRPLREGYIRYRKFEIAI